jgi:hypothetical protein
VRNYYIRTKKRARTVKAIKIDLGKFNKHNDHKALERVNRRTKSLNRG